MKRVGLLGLPQSGKSTVFQILLEGAGATATTSGGGREHVGVVRVPDERVDRLAALYQPRKTTYAQIQFVDTAALPAGGNKPGKTQDLFASVRNCDALAAVLRDFDQDGKAAAELRELEADLVLNDLALVEGRIERIDKELRIGKKEHAAERALLARCHDALQAERPLRAETLDPEEEKAVRGFQLLTLKPLLVVYNQSDSGGSADGHGPLGPHAEAVTLKALLEREVLSLPPEERERFRSELGMEEDGLSIVIRACYRLLGLISFFTFGEDEVRAWTVRRGQTAVDAAGEIHSDLARGFIRAEVVPWDKLLEAGGEKVARERAWLRLEGKEYVVQDGDCLTIRFNR